MKRLFIGLGVTVLLTAAIVAALIIASRDVATEIQTDDNSAPEQVRIACVGDSITEGYGATGYPGYLQSLVGADVQVENFGVSGSEAMTTGRFPYTTTSDYSDSLAADAGVVVLMLGSNDAIDSAFNARDFRSAYDALVQRYLALDHPPKLLLCIPIAPYGLAAEDYGFDTAIIGEIRESITAVASDHGLPVLDLYTPTDGQGSWYQSDGVHPNDTGAEAIAGIIYQKLQEEQYID
ncbi:MAG: GDSL-type esterase/lipase family protein [Peptococcaceae bacterium]|nr:GDSL-type esterase/lipase family protein [Peptococcaceae bacterium]